MKKMNNKGFTIVELVIVIAIVAVLAAILIPTFASLIKKANDSAYLQDRTNQQIADLAEKVENLNYLSWEDFEAKLAEKLAALELPEGLSKDEVQTEIKNAITAALSEYAGSQLGQNTGLTEEQVKKIVEKAMEGMLTTAQVEAIVKDAINSLPNPETVTTEQVQQIVDAAIKKLQNSVGNVGVTKEQMLQAISDALAELSIPNASDIEALVNEALKAFGNEKLTPEELKAIIDELLGDATASPIIEVIAENGQSLRTALINAVKDAPDGATLRLPANSVLDMGQAGLYFMGTSCKDNGGVGKNLTIDLNGSTLNSNTPHSDGDYYGLELPVGAHLEVANGSMDITIWDESKDVTSSNHNAKAAVYIPDAATLKLTNVNLKTNGAALFPATTASELIVDNCNIEASSYAVSTNARTSESVKITLSNSTFKAGSIAVAVNCASKMTIDNCKLIGEGRGLLVRTGHVEVSNTTITTTDGDVGTGSTYSAGYKDFSFTQNSLKAPYWGQGNQMPYAVVIIGDYSGGNSYMGDATCIMTNVTLVSANSADVPEVILAAEMTGKTATLTYDEASNIHEDYIVIFGEDYSRAGVTHAFSHNGTITVKGVPQLFYAVPATVGTFTAGGEYDVSLLNVDYKIVPTFDYNAEVKALIESKCGIEFSSTEWATVSFNFSSDTAKPNRLKYIYYTKDGESDITTIDRSSYDSETGRIDLSGIIGEHLALTNNKNVSVLKQTGYVKNSLTEFKACCAAAGITITDSSKIVIGDVDNCIVGVK